MSSTPFSCRTLQIPLQCEICSLYTNDQKPQSIRGDGNAYAGSPLGPDSYSTVGFSLVEAGLNRRNEDNLPM